MHVAEHERDPLARGKRRERDSKSLASCDRIGRIRRVGRLDVVEDRFGPRPPTASVRDAERHPYRDGAYPRVKTVRLSKPPQGSQRFDRDILRHVARRVAIAEYGYGERQRNSADTPNELLGGGRVTRKSSLDLQGDQRLTHAYLVRS